jgi:hypothetical protein
LRGYISDGPNVKVIMAYQVLTEIQEIGVGDWIGPSIIH